jgi:hypothetical protein
MAFGFKSLCNNCDFDIKYDYGALLVYRRSLGKAKDYMCECYMALALTNLSVTTNPVYDYIRIELSASHDMQNVANDIELQLSTQPTKMSVSNTFAMPVKSVDSANPSLFYRLSNA